MVKYNNVTNIIHPDAKVLIISWSPIPTPKYQKIEGSGQRFFGLASGLKKNGIKDITIAVGHIYPLDVSEVDGIKLFNYDFNDEFIERISEYDTVILNYAIHGAVFVINNTPVTTQVIFDVYGPAYIESLAREPEDLVGTYVGNLSAVNDVFNKILPRGDYFLYANDAQEKFYTGVLATLGIINQFSYKKKRLLKVPFGIDVPDIKKTYENPYVKFDIKDNDFTLLWFGGLYPWFDITKILKTIKDYKNNNIKLVIVGGNNPQNQHPDFVRNYQNVVNYIKENGIDKQVVLIDWVDYATRRKYYEYADAIISMNGEGKENHYSWRTRVMDYVGSTTPLLTNGGDPLSDELLEIGAAFRIDEDTIGSTLEDLVAHKEKMTEASESMKALQPKYYWQNVTKELAKVIADQSKPCLEEVAFRLENNVNELSLVNDTSNTPQRRSVKRLARKAIRKVKEKGFKTAATIAKNKVRNKVAFEYRRRFPKKTITPPRITILSSQLNNTGAPFVIMDIAKRLRAKYPEFGKQIRFIAFTPIDAENVVELAQNGIKTEVYTDRNLHLEFNKGDIVVFNTFAVSRMTIFDALNAVHKGILKKIFWYGHEASPENFVDRDVRDMFTKLLENQQAVIYAVSEKTKKEYARFFKTSVGVEKMPFKFNFTDTEFRNISKDSFDELRFVTTGSLMDMRKGQYPILYAFLDFYHNFYVKAPEKYRKFHLHFLGAYEKGDIGLQAPYHIRNIKQQLDLSATGLKNHFSITAMKSHDDALKSIKASNVTICYSLGEALPIFVYEGMAYGHPIIRNEAAGQEEQLVEGKNGYGVSSDDFAGFVDVIEKMLNKSKTSNEVLSSMSQLSNKIAKKATNNQYQIIEEIADIFKK
jgi:glycosyltransferase involved in cell wall biosynthesis